MIEPVAIPEEMNAVGTCSSCGGPMVLRKDEPQQTHKSHCLTCGAVPRPWYGPIIQTAKENAPS